MELIDKNKVLDEIQKMVRSISKTDVTGVLASLCGGQQYVLMEIFEFVDSLETKEVDLEKEIELVKGGYEQVDVAWNNDFDFIARHFFELGINSK